MFQRTTRWALFLTVLLSAAAASLPALAAQDTPADRYEDPNGRFSVPIPAGWNVQNADGYGVLTDPDGTIVISLLSLEASGLEDGIAEAWQTVEPGFAMEPIQVAPIPPPPGGDDAVVITYDAGEVSGEVVQALAVHGTDGVVYVMLIRADIVAAQERASQINIIVSGFTITGTEQVDLAGVQPRRFEGEMVQSFESYVTDTMDLLDVPGASIAIVQDGEVVWRGAFGVKSLGSDDPVTPETRMMIGSTTKPMTTMMLASLVDAGIITWDTPVVDILPSFAVADPALTSTITVQDLVCACTGVSRRDLELLFNFDDLHAEDVVESLASFEFFTPTGEAFQYSNQMVATAGYVGAIAVHGQASDMHDAYVTEITNRVFAPIGMEHTTFSFDDVIASGDYAMPHGLNLDGEYVPMPLETERWVQPIAPSGGAWSTVDDMSRFMRTLLAGGVAPDGSTVVSAGNLEHTGEPQVPVDASTSYGLGWFIESYKGQPLIHHGGNTLGFSSDFAFMPEAGIGIVVLTNGQGATLFTQAVRYRLLELMFGLEPEIEGQVQAILSGEAEAPSPDTSVPVSATPAGETREADVVAVTPFVGAYENGALGAVWLELDTGALYLDTGEFRMGLQESPDAPEGAMVYLTSDPPLAGLRFELRVSDTGEANLVLGSGAYTYVFVPSAMPSASPLAMPVATPAG